jgi:hypothetical protein
MTSNVTLISKRAVKWPRYRIELTPGLSYKDATHQTFQALGCTNEELSLLSQFKYDKVTGIVDTRISCTKIEDVTW